MRIVLSMMGVGQLVDLEYESTIIFLLSRNHQSLQLRFGNDEVVSLYYVDIELMDPIVTLATGFTFLLAMCLDHTTTNHSAI